MRICRCASRTRRKLSPWVERGWDREGVFSLVSWGVICRVRTDERGYRRRLCPQKSRKNIECAEPYQARIYSLLGHRISFGAKFSLMKERTVPWMRWTAREITNSSTRMGSRKLKRRRGGVLRFQGGDETAYPCLEYLVRIEILWQKALLQAHRVPIYRRKGSMFGGRTITY